MAEANGKAGDPAVETKAVVAVALPAVETKVAEGKADATSRVRSPRR